MVRYETKKIVFSKDDLPKEIKVGDVRKYFDSQIKIKDLDYRNAYGSFILCDYIYDAEERERIDGQWDIRSGVAPKEGNPFEVLHLLCSPYTPNMSSVTGYIVKDRRTGVVKGISYKHLWDLLYYEGAVNAVATVSQFGQMKSYLIDTIDELPSFSSSYWKVSLFDEEGEILVPLSKEVKLEMEKSLKRSISNRLSAQIKQLGQHLSVCDEQSINQASELIADAERITILTGAGISTMSGIPDYRSAVEGVWRKKPDLLETLNQETFLMDPDQFWDSYYQLFAVTLSEIIPVQTNEAVMTAIEMIQPNEGHKFFAMLEEKGKEIAILTQNVDGLHQKAGSKQVLEIHGNVTTCSCLLCGRRYELKDVYHAGSAPACECGCVLRPDVVFFGDVVKEYDRAKEIVANSDLIIIAGTSLQVAPFNRLADLAAKTNIPTIYINGEKPENSTKFNYILQGNISEICRCLSPQVDM